MRLRRSSFIHLVPIGPDRTLLVHAISQFKLLANDEIVGVCEFFAIPRRLPEEGPALFDRFGHGQEAILHCVDALMERGVLTEKTPDEEVAQIGEQLGESYGRDPGELLDRFRREAKEGAETYWATGAAAGVEDYKGARQRVDAILFGDCDVHMEADFLRRQAAQRGVDLRVAAAFPDDVAFAAEHAHDVIVIGALRARHAIAEPPTDSLAPHDAFVAQAAWLLAALRERTSAPILIDNLPEPTVQPLGMAERGLAGHRNRFRLANLHLADLAERFVDVHVVDVAAALAAVGAERMLDDGLVDFTHFGSPGWLLQRPGREKAAVHDAFPDVAPLAALVDGDPYGREAVTARGHFDAIAVALGLDRKKCVIVDLDGTLWPGVLAETGAPFAWAPEISGPYSYVGLYFGLHEALLKLKARGVLLACVSKNDEATVRELWRYPDGYPAHRLLTPDDFVTWRVNWNDKVGNIRSIADELGFALETFLFIDDHPVERDRVRQRLPEVEVWGEDPFALRRRLLADPRLQLPRLTDEAQARTDLVKAQLVRQKIRAETLDEADYVASLKVECRIERLAPGVGLERVEELFQRTTQFNTTGRKFSLPELESFVAGARSDVFTLRVQDRFGDHGLVGAAVFAEGGLLGFAMSCRVLGMGVERRFIEALIEALAPAWPMLSGRIVETSRNMPVRNLYRDNGFARGADGVWRLETRVPLAAAS